MTTQTLRYTKVAILLHWIIGLAIIGMIPLGVIMHDMKPGSPEQFALYQLHKSIGITILLLSVLRLLWRLSHPVPPLPDTMAQWEKCASHATHIAFYALMIGIPLTGWAIVSASPFNIPTMLYGVIPWPHLPILPGLENRKEIEHSIAEVHEVLAFGTAALIVLHVGAALRHHFILKDDVLLRMSPHPVRRQDD